MNLFTGKGNRNNIQCNYNWIKSVMCSYLLNNKAGNSNSTLQQDVYFTPTVYSGLI